MAMKSKVQKNIEAQLKSLQAELNQLTTIAAENIIRQEEIEKTIAILNGCLEDADTGNGETE